MVLVLVWTVSVFSRSLSLSSLLSGALTYSLLLFLLWYDDWRMHERTNQRTNGRTHDDNGYMHTHEWWISVCKWQAWLWFVCSFLRDGLGLGLDCFCFLSIVVPVESLCRARWLTPFFFLSLFLSCDMMADACTNERSHERTHAWWIYIVIGRCYIQFRNCHCHWMWFHK